MSQEAPSRIEAKLEQITRLFDAPLRLRSRILILAATLLLFPTYYFPLWRMSFYSNQFPDGLKLYIYTHSLEGGKKPGRDDLREINNLNHYIGMRPLLESDFSEFQWMPLLIGAFILFTWRAAVIGKMGALVDVTVAFAYFGLFSLWSFYRRLYQYGHNLDPNAAFKVEPFTPPLFGVKKIANFTVYSFPDVSSFFLIGFAVLLIYAIAYSAREYVQT